MPWTFLALKLKIHTLGTHSVPGRSIQLVLPQLTKIQMIDFLAYVNKYKIKKNKGTIRSGIFRNFVFVSI